MGGACAASGKPWACGAHSIRRGEGTGATTKTKRRKPSNSDQKQRIKDMKSFMVFQNEEKNKKNLKMMNTETENGNVLFKLTVLPGGPSEIPHASTKDPARGNEHPAGPNK